MRYDLFFLLQYWKIHWRKAIRLLLLYILLIVFTFTAFSMVRTELRRLYFEAYNASLQGPLKWSADGQGGYSWIAYCKGEEKADALVSEIYMDKSGKMYTGGRLGNDSCAYTCGFYENETACELSGIFFKAGTFPKHPGETAISELALSGLGIQAEIGDSITLSEYDEKNKKTGERTLILTGVFEDTGKRERWETCISTTGYRPDWLVEPVILLAPEDPVLNTGSRQTALMFRWKTESLASLTQEERSPYYELLDQFITDPDVKMAQGAYDSSYFTSVPNLGDQYDGIVMDGKSRFYEYACIAAAAVMAASLVCALLVLMQDRKQTIGMLQKAGYSLWRLRRMLVTEWMLFTAAGLAAGFISALAVYEALLASQYYLSGLRPCQAWQAEWGIRQITCPPAWSALLITLAASAAAYSIPVIGLKKLLAEKKIKSAAGSHSCTSILAYTRKIFRNPLLKLLQAVMLICVLTVSCAACMFYSTRGKSDPANPQIQSQGTFFETGLKLDMRDYRIHCTIETAGNSLGLIGLVETSDPENGLARSYADRLSQSGLFERCAAWTDIQNLFACYPQKADIPRGLKPYADQQFAEGEKEWYGLADRQICQIGRVMMLNDEMLEQTGADLTQLDHGKALLLSLSSKNVLTGETQIPCYTITGKQNPSVTFGMEKTGSRKIDIRISERIHLDSDFAEAESLFYAILTSDEPDYILAFSQKGAAAAGLFQKNFDHVYLSYADGTTDQNVYECLQGVNYTTSSLVVSTISRLQNLYEGAMRKETIIVYTIFIMFILMALMGYLQTIRLQIRQKKNQIAILRAVGSEKQSLWRILVYQLMKVPVLSCILGSAAVLALKKILRYRHDICQTLLENLPNGTQTGSKEHIAVYSRYRLEEDLFFIQYEMWKVPVTKFFMIVALIIVLCIFLFSAIFVYQAVQEEILPEKAE